MSRSLPGRWRSSGWRNSTTGGLLMAPGKRRKQKFHHVLPAVADRVFQLKWYCSTGAGLRGAQVRQRCGRSLGPFTSIKTRIRLCFSAFFNSGQRSSCHRSIAFSSHSHPAGRQQLQPSCRRIFHTCPGVITHSAFLLDQMGDPVRRPQTGFMPQRLRPAFEPDLDLADLLSTRARFAPGAASFLQPGAPFGFQLGCPLTHRLPMRTHPPRHLRLAQSLLRLAARIRRRSSAAKSLPAPAGNPIPPT